MIEIAGFSQAAACRTFDAPQVLARMRAAFSPDAHAARIVHSGNGRAAQIATSGAALSGVDYGAHDSSDPVLPPALSVAFQGTLLERDGLRRDLEALLQAPVGEAASEADLVLAAYQAWGPDCFDRLQGVSCFALLDESLETTWLVRDRAGIKCLYYAVADGALVYSSLLRAVVAGLPHSPELDATAVHDYLARLHVPAPRTIYDGVRKVAAGAAVRFTRDGRTDTSRYWQVPVLPYVAGGRQVDADAQIAELRRALAHSVAQWRSWGEADGLFLSGGLDSTVLAALAHRDTSRPLVAASLAIADGTSPGRSEVPAAALTAERLGIPLHRVELGVEDLLAKLDQVAEAQDEPVGDPSVYPYLKLAGTLRAQGARACLAGDGADRLFFGLNAWFERDCLDRLGAEPVGRALLAAMSTTYGVAGKGGGFHAEWVRRARAGRPVVWATAEVLTDSQARGLFSTAQQGRLADWSTWDGIEPTWSAFQERRRHRPDVRWPQFLGLMSIEAELKHADYRTISRCAGLEIRLPYVDPAIVEGAVRLPSELVRGGRRPKYALKAAMQAEVPAAVRSRQKTGIRVPLDEWRDRILAARGTAAIGRMQRELGLFDPGALRLMLGQGSPKAAWELVNLALWWQSRSG